MLTLCPCRLTAEEDGDGTAEADNMRESTETATLSRERQEEMRAISRNDDVPALLVKSFAPSIVEMDDVKLGQPQLQPQSLHNTTLNPQQVCCASCLAAPTRATPTQPWASSAAS